jgi:hypothetical protein
MARSFDDASLQYLENGNAVVSAPYTIAGFINVASGQSPSAGQNERMLSVSDPSQGVDNRRFCLGVNYDGTKWAARYNPHDGSTGVANDGTSSVAEDTWTHISATENSGENSRAVFTNGADKQTDSTALTMPTLDTTTIGALNINAGVVDYLEGKLAHIAAWNVVLTDAEIASLAAGFSPKFVRPQNLISYWRFLRTDQDIVGGYHMTAYNSPTWADQPPIIMPAPVLYSFPVAGITQTPKTVTGAQIMSGALSKKLMAKRTVTGAI